jgi:hypothetical protein
VVREVWKKGRVKIRKKERKRERKKERKKERKTEKEKDTPIHPHNNKSCCDLLCAVLNQDPGYVKLTLHARVVEGRKPV